MGNFAQRIRELAAQRPDNEPENPFLVLLRELTQGLCEEGRAVATLEPGADQRRYNLVLHPRHRPGQKHLMLAVWVERDRAVVSGEQSTTFGVPAELGQWLEDFVARPAFQESLAELARVADQPVEAYLRTVGPGVLSRDDVMVEVSAADQERLDRAAANAELELVVRAVAFPGAGTLDAARNYVALDSAGLAFSVLERTAAGEGALRLRARKRPQD